MKQFACWLLLVLGLYVIEPPFMPIIFGGIAPDLLLILVVSFAFQRGARQGALMGFLTGLLSDLATGTFFGIHILTKMIIGFSCGLFSKNVFKEQMFLPLVSVLIATAADDAVTLLFMFLLGYRPDILSHVHQLLLPTLFFNVVFALPVHYATTKMVERLTVEK